MLILRGDSFRAAILKDVEPYRRRVESTYDALQSGYSGKAGDEKLKALCQAVRDAFRDYDEAYAKNKPAPAKKTKAKGKAKPKAEA